MKKIDQIVNLIRKNLLMGDGRQLINKKQVLDENPELKTIVEELNDRQALLDEYATYRRIRKDNDRQQRMLGNIFASVRHSTDVQQGRQRRAAQLKILGVAASICICLGIFFWQLTDQSDPRNREYAISEFSEIKPGSNSARLTIQGIDESIDLKSSQVGILMGEQIQYADGDQIVEAGETSIANPIMELTTPKGGEYRITLSDGTQVTLNADSRLTYPRTFQGGQRIVELVGEAYFEVAKVKGTSFVVKTAKEDIQVLGTHFNVNAYDDEAISYVSLIEGRVKVSNPIVSKILIPGQQTVGVNGQLTVQKMNVEEVLAWKNGEFMFNNENLEKVMLKLSRWYNIETVVSPDLKDLSIWGSVSRYDSFDKVLEIIKMTNDTIKFRKEGRRVYIMK